MNRRRLLRAGVAGALGVGAVAAEAAPARAQAKRELRMVTTWPADFPGLGSAAGRLAGRIGALTRGRLTVAVHAADSLVPAFDSFDAVASGDADLYHAIESYWLAKSPAYAFFSAVPFGLTATETIAWITSGGGQPLWDALSAPFNIKPLMAGHTGSQSTGWFTREIASAEDLRGLRLALPGLGGRVMRQLGASAVALPGRDLAAALAAGTIDGVEGYGPWHSLTLGLPAAARYAYYPGVHEPGTILSVGINRELWPDLAAEDRAAIEAAALAETLTTLAEFETANARAVETLRGEGAVEPRRFPEAVLAAIGAAAGGVVAEIAAGDATTAQVYAAFLAFRRSAVTWSKVSLHAYLNARLLPFPYGAPPP